VSLFLLMLLGYIARKSKLIDKRVNAGLANLLLKFSLPCSIFVSMQRVYSRDVLRDSFAVLAACLLLYLVVFGLGRLFLRRVKGDPEEKKIWFFVLLFANVGYAGFPIVEAIFGMDGLIYTSMANAAFNLTVFTLGIYLFQTEFSAANGKRLLQNPALHATIIGFIFFLTSWPVPTPIGNAISIMGGTTTPISMVVVGSTLADCDIKTIFAAGKSYVIIFLRLLILPLLAFAIGKLFIHNATALGVTVVLAGMPAASVTVIFAEQYKSDTLLASQMIFITTVLSMLSIPLLILLLF
jgi:predicted permease